MIKTEKVIAKLESKLRKENAKDIIFAVEWIWSQAYRFIVFYMKHDNYLGR